MTSVEDALSFTGVGAFAPMPTASASASASAESTVVSDSVVTVSDSAVAPRPTGTLARRWDWERRHRTHLRLSDAVTVLAAVATGTAIEVCDGASASGAILRNLLLATLWMALLGVLRTRGAALLGTTAEERKKVAEATVLAFGMLAVVAVVLEWAALRPTILVSLPLGLVGLLLGRQIWRNRLRTHRKQGRSVSRALVVGNRDDVEYTIRALQPVEASGYQVVGATLLDGNARDLFIEDARIPVFGSVGTVGTVASLLNTDAVVLASRPAGDPDFVKRLSWRLEGTATELVLSSRLPDVARARLSFSAVDGLPLIRVRVPNYQGARHVFKRLVDVIAATLALIPIGLIAPVLAAVIKLDSPGPVFFRQERVGRDGRTFMMVKFRSMRTDAEHYLAALKEQNQGSGLLFKMKADPRVTRVGRVLRKLSLDELPQFWNVLLGDMSVVGPRPPLPCEVADYEPEVFRRLFVKPGITGLWQVSGRSDLSWEESVRLDLRYVENWSVANDLQIMCRTAKVMIQPSGAY